MVHWSWPTRLAVSGFFFAFSTSLLIFAHRLWIWGWIVGAVILLIPVFFPEKHHEYQGSDGEVLARAEMTLQRDVFFRLFTGIAEIFPRSVSTERRNSISRRVSELKAGESATFSLHLKNDEIESPLELTVRAGQTNLSVRACGRDPALSLLKRIAAKLGASSSI